GQGLDLHANGTPPAPATNAILAAARQTILAHGDQKRPELILAGSAADAPGMRDQVARALQTPVLDIGDFDYSPMIHGDRATPKRFAGCIAMLVGEAPVEPLELINFRRGEFAFRGRSGAIAPLRVTMMLALAAVAIAIVQFVLGVASGERELHLLNQQVAVITAPALGVHDPATAKDALQVKIADMGKQLRLMGGGLGHGSPLDVLLALSRAIPGGLPMQVDTLQIDDAGMKLEGEADSFTTVDQVKRALERSGDFTAIQVDHAAAGSDASKVDFHLTATLAD
ncbi:MAG TPA: PilN domain-containing protein, partial [Candidatus Binataceae bacterium]|nr:PilN domain-containing protein [Candidatus Binataceae bacterium]